MIANNLISIRVKLSGAVATNQCPITGHFVQMSDAGVVYGVQPIHSATNSTTAVTIVPTAFSGLSVLKNLQVANEDTASIEVIIEQYDGSTAKTIALVPLAINQYLTLDAEGKITVSTTGGIIGTGTVTQVQGNGTVNGLSLSGNVTTSGNITLGGSLTGSAPALTVGNATTAGNVTNLTGSSGTPTSINLTNGIALPLTTGVTGLLPIANGGTNANVTRPVAQIVSTSTGTVATGTTTIPLDNTIPQNTEGDQYMSLSITPKSATSTLLISVHVQAANNSALQVICSALFQDSTANALACKPVSAPTADTLCNMDFLHVMTSGTTSATTFKVRVGARLAGTTTFNGAGGAQFYGGTISSSIVITELL